MMPPDLARTTRLRLWSGRGRSVPDGGSILLIHDSLEILFPRWEVALTSGACVSHGILRKFIKDSPLSVFLVSKLAVC